MKGIKFHKVKKCIVGERIGRNREKERELASQRSKALVENTQTSKFRPS